MADPEPAVVLAAIGLPAPTETMRAVSTDAAVWRVQVDGRDLALRLYRPGVHPGRDRLAARLAGAAGVPVPVPVATGSFEGRAVDVTSWCPGWPVADALAARLAAGEADAGAQICHRFGRQQAQMHELELGVDADGLRDEAAVLKRAAPDAALMARLQTVLAARPARPRALLHMDYHPFNVLDDGQQVTGVVDWTNAAVGDPRLDLARTRSLFVLAEVLRPELAGRVDLLLREYRIGYEQLRPMPDDADLAPFLACAGRLLLADWQPRVAAGQAPARLLELAGAWATQWRTRAVTGAAS